MRNKKDFVYIVDGSRTPFIRALRPNPLTAGDLAVAAASPLLTRQPFEPKDLDEVIVGCVGPGSDEANIGRIIALRLGCGNAVEGWTVQRNCASGLQALECGAERILSGNAHLILAGGTECMSRAPLLYQTQFVTWLADFRSGKGFVNKIKSGFKFRPQLLKPVISLLKALNDPIVDLSMGQTAENLAYRFNISRNEMDLYAVQSHQRLSHAIKQGLLEEITPIFEGAEKAIFWDNGLREDSSVEKLNTLKPVFDKPFGNVTAGNSSQITDGAAFLILASKTAVEKYKLPVLGKIVDTAWAALDPTYMGLGPVYAIQKVLKAQNLTVSDIDYWEINEAFSAQVLACMKAIGEGSKPLGIIPEERLNVDGGAIAIGHPVGASGARLVLHLLHVLKRNQAKRGIASLCIGGGQGGAMIVENVSEVS